MISQIGDIIIDKISGLPFIDKYTGVVKILSYKDKLPNGNFQTKKFPAACNITLDECSTGRYKDLIPDDSKKSVLYLEDRGMRFIKKEGANISWRASYNLICWLNMPKLGFNDCSYSAIAITSIVSKLPTTPFNSPLFNNIYQKVNINLIGQESKANSPFAKYSYDETINQFLMYPFDYFTLLLDVDFTVNQKCIEIPALNPPILCK